MQPKAPARAPATIPAPRRGFLPPGFGKAEYVNGDRPNSTSLRQPKGHQSGAVWGSEQHDTQYLPAHGQASQVRTNKQDTRRQRNHANVSSEGNAWGRDEVSGVPAASESAWGEPEAKSSAWSETEAKVSAWGDGGVKSTRRTNYRAPAPAAAQAANGTEWGHTDASSENAWGSVEKEASNVWNTQADANSDQAVCMKQVKGRICVIGLRFTARCASLNANASHTAAFHRSCFSMNNVLYQRAIYLRWAVA